MGVQKRDLTILVQIAQKFGDNIGTLRGVTFFRGVYYAGSFSEVTTTASQAAFSLNNIDIIYPGSSKMRRICAI